jgi:hypothetical protein
MPRTPNTRPTTIYWLIDVRPQTLVLHPGGKPFYCGKTVQCPARRLHEHHTAVRSYPNRQICLRLSECGKQVRINHMEVVQSTEDWRERERFWIATLRYFYPDCVNVSSGGDGVPGLVHSAETRAKWSAQRKGKKRGPMSEEHKAKIGNANRGKPVSNETRAIRSELARNRTAEHRAKIRAAHIGKTWSEEQRARLSAIRKGKPRSLETRAKISAAHIGKTHSAESRAKMSAAAKARHCKLVQT